ncbi:2-hydroxymuconate tautomerase [Salinicoccus halitifaciens]|nr:2-hydroxymuconate tautomerase [Salinicoccus halitifaciens]
MPIIHMNLVEGRDDETIRNCVQEVSKTVSETLDAPLESVRVIVNEVPKNRFSVGGKMKDEK